MVTEPREDYFFFIFFYIAFINSLSLGKEFFKLFTDAFKPAI